MPKKLITLINNHPVIHLVFVFILIINLSLTADVYAETTHDEYNSYERYGYIEGSSEADDSDIITNARTGYSLYYEQFQENTFAGYTPTAFFQVHDNSDTWLYLEADFRVGYVEAYIPKKPNVVLGTMNIGLGIDYGISKGFPLNLYSEIGFDLIEFIANEILRPDNNNENSPVDIDTFFTIGLGYQINKRYRFSLYGKTNNLSGYYIRDHSEIYYGGKITIFTH